MYNFRIIDITELKEIEYHENFPSSRFQWLYNWVLIFDGIENNVLGYKREPFIIAAFQDKDLVAIVPLVKLYRTYFNLLKVEFLEFLGQQWSSLGNDILQIKKLDEGFSGELISWIKKNIHFHFLFFKYLPGTSVLSRKFRLFHYAGAPFIRVHDYSTYEEFSSKVYTRKFREDLRRTLRKIKREGFEFEISFDEINDSSMEHIKRIAKSKETDGKSFLYGNSEKAEFHLQMYKNFPSQVVFIKFNNHAVAYGTSIDWNGERIGIDAAFDREYRNYGAGIHCIDSFIQKSFIDKKQKLSFGMGLDTYKFQFTNQIEDFYMCFDFKYRLKALLALPYFIYRLKKEEQKVQGQLQKVQVN